MEYRIKLTKGDEPPLYMARNNFVNVLTDDVRFARLFRSQLTAFHNEVRFEEMTKTLGLRYDVTAEEVE